MVTQGHGVMGKERVFLNHKQGNLKVTGKLTYNNGDGLYTNMRLKKEILQTFSMPLNDPKVNFMYVMQVFTTWEEFEKEIKTLKKQVPVVPFLFNIAKESK